VDRDVTPVKGWRHKGDSCETGPAMGLAAVAPESEARGLWSEGITGCA
jgi:hypothetical protein